MRNTLLFFLLILVFSCKPDTETYNITHVTELKGTYNAMIRIHSGRDLMTYYIGGESGTITRKGFEFETEFFETEYFTFWLNWDNHNIYVETTEGNKMYGDEREFVFAMMSDDYPEECDFGMNNKNDLFEFTVDSEFWEAMSDDKMQLFLSFPIEIN